MNASTDQIQFTAYGPERFPRPSALAERGYLFTVPGDFPEGIHPNCHVTDWEMAVYRNQGEWEVQVAEYATKVWGTGPSRRVAAGLALLEIERHRRTRAKEIAENRVSILGLEAVPPYEVEVTDEVTLVLTPEVIAHLDRTEPADGDRPAHYQVTDPDGGGSYTIRDDGRVSLHPLTVGVLHVRCGCAPAIAARFENERDAVAHIREALNAWSTCPESPSAPAAADDQPDDEDQAVEDALADDFEHAYKEAEAAREAMHEAGIAMVARVIRRALPDATRMSVRIEDLALVLVESDNALLWAEQGSSDQLHVGMVNDVRAHLADVLAFGQDPEVLDELGWTQPDRQTAVFTVALPK
ncbi:hypothetical protein [Streptomyces sp. NPDC058548]|uniref:hypothetical protein n=1 Tax=Streptomyces sp. NPDC058548 TaxID=3346545 RepID=UPI0036636626